MDHEPYSSAEFHNDIQKQLVHAVSTVLADSKLEWAQIAPFLEAARAICRDDFRLNGRLALHGVEYRDADLVDADEAYLSISIRDREDAVEWLSETYWLSDIALADQDPARVRSAVEAMERTLVKLRKWLAAQETEAAHATAPDATGAEADPKSTPAP